MKVKSKFPFHVREESILALSLAGNGNYVGNIFKLQLIIFTKHYIPNNFSKSRRKVGIC